MNWTGEGRRRPASSADMASPSAARFKHSGGAPGSGLRGSRSSAAEYGHWPWNQLGAPPGQSRSLPRQQQPILQRCLLQAEKRWALFRAARGTTDDADPAIGPAGWRRRSTSRHGPTSMLLVDAANGLTIARSPVCA